MSSYRLSKLTETDLEGIADYTVDRWGEAQAIRYITELLECCERISLNPGLGRACPRVRPGYRRFEQGKHVLFYQQIDGEVVIQRILHQRMLPDRHEMDGSVES